MPNISEISETLVYAGDNRFVHPTQSYELVVTDHMYDLLGAPSELTVTISDIVSEVEDV